MTQYVIYNEEFGVYIGSFLGLGFWTKLDPVGQSEVCCFPSPKEARKYMRTWDKNPATMRLLKECRFVAVQTPEGVRTVPMATCVAAGLPAWDYMEARISSEGITQKRYLEADATTWIGLGSQHLRTKGAGKGRK